MIFWRCTIFRLAKPAFCYFILPYAYILFIIYTVILLYVFPVFQIYATYKHVPMQKIPLYLRKAGLASRNIVHLQKIILRCVGFWFYIFLPPDYNMQQMVFIKQGRSNHICTCICASHANSGIARCVLTNHSRYCS